MVSDQWRNFVDDLKGLMDRHRVGLVATCYSEGGREMITTSRSAVVAYQRCPRLRWWQYEAPNGTTTPGWERKRLAIPLVTGIYTHEGIEQALTGATPQAAAQYARQMYLSEVQARGLAVEEGLDEMAVIDEQTAHVEAMVLAWCRVRLPRWLDEYDIVEVEEEDRVALSDDVTLAVRRDAVVRRKLDGRLFLVNFKTVSQADERWMRAWEVDMQLMTELLAAENKYAEQFGGVIIEGLVKGARVGVDDRLVEVRGDDRRDKITSYIDRSRLLYGYKCDADPPLRALEYQWESTTRKGWYKFRTWKEQFSVEAKSAADWGISSSLEYWINWLPEEVVESQFVIVPPIVRDQERIESKVRQITEIERNIRKGINYLGKHRTMVLDDGGSIETDLTLDETFPQNEHSCTYPTKCPMYEMCWERQVADDPQGSGLYVPRIDHHKEKVSG